VGKELATTPLYPEYVVEPSPESVAETAPVIAVPAPVELAMLRQKSSV
jgi:hypothetical protein